MMCRVVNQRSFRPSDQAKVHLIRRCFNSVSMGGKQVFNTYAVCQYNCIGERHAERAGLYSECTMISSVRTFQSSYFYHSGTEAKRSDGRCTEMGGVQRWEVY